MKLETVSALLAFLIVSLPAGNYSSYFYFKITTLKKR